MLAAHSKARDRRGDGVFGSSCLQSKVSEPHELPWRDLCPKWKSSGDEADVVSGPKEQTLTGGRLRPLPSQRMLNLAQSAHGLLGEGAMPSTGVHFFFRQPQEKHPFCPVTVTVNTS